MSSCESVRLVLLDHQTLGPPMGNHVSDVHTPRHRAGNAHVVVKHHGRRALPPPITDPVNTGPLAITPPAIPAGIRRVAVAALATGALVAGLATGQAAPKAERKVEAHAVLDEPITAPDVELPVTEVEVKTEAAPPPPPPKPEPVPVEVPAPVAVPPKPARPPAVQAAPAPVAKAPAPPVSVAPAGRAEVIVNAALAQARQIQDCTRLVTRALAAAGINFHGWPIEYYSLGYAVSASEARPGDLIYYADGGAGLAHIAVYLGNGEAMHGGFNGNQSVRWTANVPAPATAAQYIRLR